jgi:fatty acid desaturase
VIQDPKLRREAEKVLHNMEDFAREEGRVRARKALLILIALVSFLAVTVLLLIFLPWWGKLLVAGWVALRLPVFIRKVRIRREAAKG